MSNESALIPKPTQPAALALPAEFSAFGSIQHFEAAQRMAKALCSSTMVPEAYRGEQNIGSCIIALEISNRIGANILSVMQNLYVVHGKPAWSSQFLIATANASRKFSPLRYRATGTPGQDSMGCVAWATDKTGEKLESPEITIAMAKAEGWYQKNGSKWKTMPELMLRYRAATLFVRLYAPEISMGIHCDDEVIDIVEVAPVVTDAPVFTTPLTPRKKRETPTLVDVPPVDAATEVKAETVQEAPVGFDQAILESVARAEVTELQVVTYWNTLKKASIKALSEIPADSLAKMLSNPGLIAEIKKVKVGE